MDAYQLPSTAVLVFCMFFAPGIFEHTTVTAIMATPASEDPVIPSTASPDTLPQHC